MVLPAAAADLTEATSRTLAQQVEQVLVSTPLVETPIPSTYVRQGQGTPILLLHGFDSSLFEFRRLLPLLATTAETWALDLLGFGFSDRTLSPSFDPGAIKLHLHSFWQQQIGQPMVLVGASMGGAAALDFTLTYPDAVQKLVLLDSAGFAVGPAMEKVMVPPLDRWATAFLKNAWVRRRISLNAYCDRAWVTADAELCASLHLACPRWSEALIAFTKSGGYNFLSDKISQITVPTQVIWGRQDQILGTADAEKFVGAIANSQLVWIDQCGHVPHLEQAQATAEVIIRNLAQSDGQ
ncbi:MAG: alpha/beta fold hydrolase [Cyanobacteria bacterium]|nr:alpha/beta fold hydrolase [Cyanobacteriota bacterium]